MSKKRILILGAGYGGILTAKRLGNKLDKDSQVEITLIDKNPFHTMRTELHEVACGRVEEDSIRIDLKKVFAKRKVDVVLDEIKDIDFNKQVLKSDKNIYTYDYLVIGAGSQPTFFGIKGAKEHTFPLWNYEDAVKLKEHILHMFRKAVKETDKVKRKKMLTFVVVGGGFTGVEMMGELGEWKDRLCEDFYLDNEEVKLCLVDASPRIIPTYPEHLMKKAVERLHKLGVEVITGAGITEVSEDYVILGDKGRIGANTVVWAAGVEGGNILEKMELEQKGRKRIVVNDKLQTTDCENVYVVGDNIFYIVEGEERPVPQMVENAKFSAKLVTENICRDLKGEKKKSYKPSFHGSLLCIGSRYGLAHLGLPGKFFAVQGFLAMFMKHAVNLLYFLSVAGFNKCWTYLLDEFVHINDNRSIVGGTFARLSPNFWLVPLRIYIGALWLQHGLQNMIMGEIAVGICLILGLFTAVSAIASIGMSVVLSNSAIGSMGYIAASIALLSGAGRTLGLDYYVLPIFKKVWKKIGIVKKHYLYVD